MKTTEQLAKGITKDGTTVTVARTDAGCRIVCYDGSNTRIISRRTTAAAMRRFAELAVVVIYDNTKSK